VTLQVLVWLSSCSSWSEKLEVGRTLEGDLDCYLEPIAMFTNAVNKFLEDSKKDSENRPIADRFCIDCRRLALPSS
jgi:hypothetical protein